MLRYTTSPVTFEPTEAMIKEAFAAFNKSLAQVQNITQISWILNLEPLPPQIYKVQGGSGANTLSITGQGGRSPVVCLISVGWPDAAQNQQVYDAARALMDDISARAKTLGTYDSISTSTTLRPGRASSQATAPRAPPSCGGCAICMTPSIPLRSR